MRNRNRVAKRKTSSSVTINTDPSKNKLDMLDLTYLIYGERKIGKTSFLSHFPDTYFFMFEPGAKSLKIAQNNVPSWDDFLSLIDQLEEHDDIATTVIDTGALAYERCFEHICEKMGIEHPQDISYGKAWSAIKQEFNRAHTKLLSMGKGFVVTAHSTVVERETRSGTTFSQTVPDYPSAADKLYTGIIDTIGFYHYHGSERFLQIRGDDYVLAGTRCEDNFLTPDGEQVYRVPMGNSSKEAFDNFVRAFNNKQTETFKQLEKSKSNKTNRETFRRRSRNQ